MRLSAATLAQLRRGVARFAYDRAAQASGVVHFGIGAFHRAHMAWYTDRAMDAGDRDWMISGISLRSPSVAAQLNPQDGLYTLTERDAAGGRTRVVGAVREVLVAGSSADRIVARLAAPETRIASFTVTEKGYCRAPDGSLDLEAARSGVYPLLAAGLRRRRDAGAAGLTFLSCDNLAHNGRQLAALMRAYLDAEAPDVAGWFEDRCTCPSTMVDRIVPATTDADRRAVAEAIGMADEGAVVTEPFSQWVIEDRFAAGRPAWDALGAELVADVAPYETAKLRMLNGAHSLLAYCGLRRGHVYVHQAIADPLLRRLVDALIRDEAAPTIAAAPGQDLDRYADALIARFANPALDHRLAQIAVDGSQKLPQRWLETLAAARAQERRCPAILAGLAAWIAHVRGANGPVDDPMAARFATLADACDGAGMIDALFGEAGLFASWWTADAHDRAALLEGMAT